MKLFYDYDSFGEAFKNDAHKKIKIHKDLDQEIKDYLVFYYDNPKNKKSPEDIEFMLSYLGSFFGPYLNKVFSLCKIEKSIQEKKELLKEKENQVFRTWLKRSVIIGKKTDVNNQIKVTLDNEKISNFFNYKNKNSASYKIFNLLLTQEEFKKKAAIIYSLNFIN